MDPTGYLGIASNWAPGNERLITGQRGVPFVEVTSRYFIGMHRARKNLPAKRRNYSAFVTKRRVRVC